MGTTDLVTGETLALRRSQAGWPLTGFAAFLAITVAGLLWAKWYPYFHKAFVVAGTHKLGTSILTGARTAPPEPSVAAAVSYATTYFNAIWVALVAGLLIAAAVEAFLPRHWLLRVLSARGFRGTTTAGLLAVPCMMCTCCSAPLAVSLRRSGVPGGTALAFWVGNPALNPAVILFAAFVLPWQWVALRAAGGVLLVFIAIAVIAQLLKGRQVEAEALSRALVEGDVPASAIQPVGRYLRALGRLSLTLLPEYLVIVLLLGAFRGWLFPLAHGVESLGPVAVVVFALAGALFAIPTAGEIPIVQGLLHAGIAPAAVGALLVPLPAISLPSLAMVWRSFPSRLLLALFGAVAAVGILTGIAAGIWLS